MTTIASWEVTVSYPPKFTVTENFNFNLGTEHCARHWHLRSHNDTKRHGTHRARHGTAQGCSPTKKATQDLGGIKKMEPEIGLLLE